MTLEERFWSKVDKDGPGGCWEWMASKFRDGYGQIKIERQNRKTHRVSWELVNGPIPNDLLVLHKCDNRACVNPDHLFLGTHDDNAKDRNKKGRQAQILGSERYNAKLTERIVKKIRELFDSGEMRQVDLYQKFGMSQAVMSRILNRKVWKHI
jgi:hypothetical protein